MAMLAALLSACAGRTASTSAGVTSSDSSSSPDVGASGLVVARSATDVRFCSGPFPLSLVPGPPRCAARILVTGVDLAALSDRTARHGVTWGTAYLAGRFSGGVLHVSKQGPPRPADTGPRLADPPSPPPAGGWADGQGGEPSTAAVTAYRKQFPSDVTSVAIFHPRPRAWVVTVASTNPARTTVRLAAAYPGRLCVLRSRYHLGDVRRAKAAAMALLSARGGPRAPYRVTTAGLTTGADGQPVVQVSAVSETPALRAALASQPAGLVTIVPWLRPVSG